MDSPAANTDRSPIILVHGAANSSSVWTFWEQDLIAHGWSTHAINLRGHGAVAGVDLSQTSMDDYAGDVIALARQSKDLPVLIGWSMGGLVAMMAAVEGKAAACITLAPSMPARRTDQSVELRYGEFTAEEYGITSRDPKEQPAMPDLDIEERAIALASLGRESRFARDQRKRGIIIESLPCPLLNRYGHAGYSVARPSLRQSLAQGGPSQRRRGLTLGLSFEQTLACQSCTRRAAVATANPVPPIGSWPIPGRVEAVTSNLLNSQHQVSLAVRNVQDTITKLHRNSRGPGYMGPYRTKEPF